MSVDHSQPVHVKIVGDAATAAPYISIGKNETRRFAAENPDPVRIRSKWGMFDKDVHYHMHVKQNHLQLTIFAHACSLADSGAYSEKLPVYSSLRGEWLVPDSTVEDWVVDFKKDAQGNYVLGDDGKRIVVASAFYDLHTKKKPTPHQAVRMGTGYSGSETGLKDHLVMETRFLHKFKASKYSGTMRKVVQVMLGKGYRQLASEGFAGGNPLAPTFVFNYSFSETHGIYISQKTGAWWVVKINRSGVFVRGASWCPIKVKGRDDVKYFSGYLTRTDDRGDPLPEDEQWTKIGSTSEFYKLGGLFSACGWAFNPQGTAAQNVNFDVVYMGAVRSPYMKTFRWKITLSEDSETGAPSSAALAMVESGVIWNADKVSSGIGHFQVPDDELGMLVTFDYNMDHFVTPPVDCNGPLYVYYDDSGSEIVVRSRRDKVKEVASQNVSNTLVDIDIFVAGGVLSTRPERMFGTSANPLSVDDRFESLTYTNATSYSEVISCSKYTPPVTTEGHGGMSSARYKEVSSSGDLIAASFVYTFLEVMYSKFSYDAGPPVSYCEPRNGGSIPQGGWAIPVQGFVKPVRMVRETVSESAREVRTDCAGCIPYGERQAVVLSSYIFARGYTTTVNRTGQIGYRHEYSYFAFGPWATDKTCYNNIGDIGPGPNSNWAAVHWCGVGDTYHYFGYSDGWTYQSSVIDSADLTVSMKGASGITRLIGKTGVVPGASNSVSVLDWSTRAVIDETVLEPAPRTRKMYDGYGTTYTHTYEAESASPIVVTVPHQYQHNAAIVGASGAVNELSGLGWAGVLLRDYAIDNPLHVDASYDAFDSANKYMYSQSPGSYAKVTYPGVSSYTADGCFGFVGYEDTTDGD